MQRVVITNPANACMQQTSLKVGLLAASQPPQAAPGMTTKIGLAQQHFGSKKQAETLPTSMPPTVSYLYWLSIHDAVESKQPHDAKCDYDVTTVHV